LVEPPGTPQVDASFRSTRRFCGHAEKIAQEVAAVHEDNNSKQEDGNDRAGQ
jgi:hypothetical protein